MALPLNGKRHPLNEQRHRPQNEEGAARRKRPYGCEPKKIKVGLDSSKPSIRDTAWSRINTVGCRSKEVENQAESFALVTAVKGQN